MKKLFSLVLVLGTASASLNGMRETSSPGAKNKVMKDTFFVVLAGGSGERLWPLSSQARPKQLLPFINGSSLLEQTVHRVQPLVKNKNHLVVVTNTGQLDAVKKVIGKQATVFAEPEGRNTAPAILTTCLEINEKNEDAVVVVLPSDHFMPQPEKFVSLLCAAVAYASCYDQLVLLGVKPTFPATGYGYIQYQADRMVPGWMCFPVQKFHEKPAKDQAQAYLDQGDMLWNIGIFVGRVQVFLEQFKQHAPDLYQAVQAQRKNELQYSQVPRISIDHAVLEKSDKVVVFPADFEWHDVGTLSTFLTLKAQHEKETKTRVISVDAHDNLVCASKKVVAFVGVSNVCVVEAEDALLIVAQDRVESVRDIVSLIKEEEKKEKVG